MAAEKQTADPVVQTDPEKVRRDQAPVRRRVPGGVYAVGVVVLLGLGYVAGAYHTQVISVIAPAVGIKSYAGSLDLSSLQKTYQDLKANYDGTIDNAAVIEGANKGLVNALGDQYTVYMDKAEANEFNNDLSGTIGGGIGVELSLRNGKVTVVRVLKDNPAEKAGVQVGDIIEKINDQAVADNATTADVVSKVRGDAGTTVKLSVLRGTEMKDFSITRETVSNPSVYSRVDNGIGIMTITRFDEQTGQLARAAAASFKDQNVKAVILDLRGNGGGYITAAQDVASLWLNNQVVVSERTNGKVVDTLKSGTNPILNGLPTVVLVNSSSASASEIVAGALQDHKTAQLVGEKTFGKGSVQKILPLTDGAQLKVTVARWYTPNGKNISQQGIAVDKMVAISADDINAGRDPQLAAAEALLQQ